MFYHTRQHTYPYKSNHKMLLASNNVETLEWPVKSPDLNQIKNLCSNQAKFYQQGRQFT